MTYFAHHNLLSIWQQDIEAKHRIAECVQEDSAASHFQLAALMGSNGVELLVSNSTVRCLKQPHMNSLVHFLLGPQSQHKSGSSSDSNSTWIIIVAGVLPLPSITVESFPLINLAWVENRKEWRSCLHK